MTDGLSDVEAELLAREPIFRRPEFGSTRAAYLAQTAEDSWEVGASARVHDRAHVVDTLLHRGKVPGDENWEISDVRCRPLADGRTRSPYRLDEDGRLSRRLTLWHRDPDGWKILYHRGTLIQDA